MDSYIGATGWTTGVRFPAGAFFFSPPHPVPLRIPSSLLSNRNRQVFPRGQSGRCMNLTTCLQLAPGLITRGAIPSLPYTSSWRST